MQSELHVLVSLDGDRFAIPARQVEQVVLSVAVTPLPGAPDVVVGVVEVHGELRPVLSARARVGKPQPPVRLQDKLLLLQANQRGCALLVDEVGGVVSLAPETIAEAMREDAAGMGILGVARLPDGLAVVFDLERFLSPAEAESMETAMAG